MHTPNSEDVKQTSSEAVSVSICCTAFNHEDYIADAIESFLAQKSDFKFEIIIHDDFSSDETANIIREYELRFPELIKPIYQNENQWSKGVYSTFYFALCAAKGKYIAVCDGDDYWLSPHKLQKQVDAMETFRVDMCGHPALRVLADGTRTAGHAGKMVHAPTYFTARDLFDQNGNMLPMSSIMISERIKRDLIENMPPVRFHTGFQLMGARRTGLCILPEVMSAYRMNVPNSASGLLLGSPEKKTETAKKRLKSLNRIYQLYDKSTRKHLKPLLANQLNNLVVADWHEKRSQLKMLTALSLYERICVVLIALRKRFVAKLKGFIRSVRHYTSALNR